MSAPVVPNLLKQQLPKQGMAWHLRHTITGFSRWDNHIVRAFADVGVPMKKREFQTYMTDMFFAARDLVERADEDTTLEEFCRGFGRSDPMAAILKKNVVAGEAAAGHSQAKRDAAPAKAEKIFRLFFDAVVKGRGRYFQRRLEAGLPVRPAGAVDCPLAIAVDHFELAAPFYQWDVIQPLVAADVEAHDLVVEIGFDDDGNAVAQPANPFADNSGDQSLAEMMDAVEVDTADTADADADAMDVEE